MADAYLLRLNQEPEGTFVATGWVKADGDDFQVFSSYLAVSDGPDAGDDGAGTYYYDIGTGFDTGVYMWNCHAVQDAPSIRFGAVGGASTDWLLEVTADLANNRFVITPAGGSPVYAVVGTSMESTTWTCRAEWDSGDVTFRVKMLGDPTWETSVTCSPTGTAGSQLGVHLAGESYLYEALEYNPDPNAEPSDPVVPHYDLPTPVSGDVWGQDLNNVIRNLHLGPGGHEALPPASETVERAIFACTTHHVVHINIDGEWVDYFPFPTGP